MFSVFGSRNEPPEIFSSYPSFNRPFPGDPGKLSILQVEANIKHLYQVHDERLEIATAFLNDHGIEVSNLGWRDFFQKLDDIGVLIEQILVPVSVAHAPRHLSKVSKSDWVATFGGRNIIYSFLTDISILCFHHLNTAFDGKLRWDTLSDQYLDPGIAEAIDLSVANRIVVCGLHLKSSGVEMPEDIELLFFCTVRAGCMDLPAFARPLSEVFGEKIDEFEAR